MTAHAIPVVAADIAEKRRNSTGIADQSAINSRHRLSYQGWRATEPSGRTFMTVRFSAIVAVVIGLSLPTLVGKAWAHGDVVPQPVDISGLTPVGEDLQSVNPYRDKPDYDRAKEIGEKAYNQNCARCHGLGAVSGGIAPDLRYLVPGDDDEYFLGRVMTGAVRNGVTYMPAFGEIFSQEAIWSIRSWLDTVAEQ
jgi:cytochrome c-550 PedF